MPADAVSARGVRGRVGAKLPRHESRRERVAAHVAAQRPQTAAEGVQPSVSVSVGREGRVQSGAEIGLGQEHRGGGGEGEESRRRGRATSGTRDDSTAAARRRPPPNLLREDATPRETPPETSRQGAPRAALLPDDAHARRPRGLASIQRRGPLLRRRRRRRRSRRRFEAQLRPHRRHHAVFEAPATDRVVQRAGLAHVSHAGVHARGRARAQPRHRGHHHPLRSGFQPVCGSAGAGARASHGTAARGGGVPARHLGHRRGAHRRVGAWKTRHRATRRRREIVQAARRRRRRRRREHPRRATRRETREDHRESRRARRGSDARRQGCDVSRDERRARGGRVEDVDARGAHRRRD